MTGLTVRKLNIDFSQGFGRRWLGGDAYRTALFNALSMSFPIGEQSFIDSVRAAPDACLVDPVLRAQVKSFIGQEASHRHVHVQYNAQLTAQGFDYIMEPVVARRLRALDKMDVRTRLAVTVAFEHYTALLADGVLTRPRWMAGAEPALRTLWEWHAVEETEHKSVAFDVYRACGGGYWRRVLMYLQVSLIFMADTTVQTGHNLHRDGSLFKPGTWLSFANTWFGRDGIAWHLVVPGLQYFSPRFRPWQHDNRALVARWLAQNGAAYRAITPQGQDNAA